MATSFGTFQDFSGDFPVYLGHYLRHNSNLSGSPPLLSLLQQPFPFSDLPGIGRKTCHETNFDREWICAWLFFTFSWPKVCDANPKKPSAKPADRDDHQTVSIPMIRKSILDQPPLCCLGSTWNSPSPRPHPMITCSPAILFYENEDLVV